jgi:hypothetical protein
MAHQGFDLQLTRYDEKGWRATFYTTGMEHSADERGGHHELVDLVQRAELPTKHGVGSIPHRSLTVSTRGIRLLP